MSKQPNDKSRFGFWIYLMTDLIMFAVLFACFAVLKNNTFGGPASEELIDLLFVLLETIILLTSSFTCGLANYFSQKQEIKQTQVFLSITIALGVSFLFLEVYEFSGLIKEGASFQRSAFLSSFFALVGTHGLHIFSGVIWMSVLLVQTLKRGLKEGNIRKLTLASLFWHFLDIVWIFIFSFVYLIGAL